MKKDFKIGDKVRFLDRSGCYCCFKKGDILKVIGNGFLPFIKNCESVCDKIEQCVHIEDIELINDESKVIFNGNTTILLKDGKKYVTKCLNDDKFDREKGLLLCLAKAHGVTYKDLQEMLKSAEVQESKPKQEEKCEPLYKFNVGDYVEVVNTREQYSRYDPWFSEEGNAPELLTRFEKSDKILSKLKTYRIVARGKHNWGHPLYAIEAFDKQIYLIDEQGLKLANVREVKRLAKAGEYVKIVNKNSDPANKYENGDILEIKYIYDDIFPHYGNGGTDFLYKSEYVVLENYKGGEQ